MRHAPYILSKMKYIWLSRDATKIETTLRQPVLYIVPLSQVGGGALPVL